MKYFFLLILSKALSTMDVLKHIILRLWWCIRFHEIIHACDLQILCEQSKFIEVVVLFLHMVKTVPSSSSLPPSFYLDVCHLACLRVVFLCCINIVIRNAWSLTGESTYSNPLDLQLRVFQIEGKSHDVGLRYSHLLWRWTGDRLVLAMS
jgi:hypothetical protein